MIRKDLPLIGIGVAAGLGGSVAVREVIGVYLFAVAPTDLPTLVSASALLCGVALTASYMPIRRALRLGPMRALQNESR